MRDLHQKGSAENKNLSMSTVWPITEAWSRTTFSKIAGTENLPDLK
ncbi:hypothetical protein EGR_07804 [Echinococcus granulosus]|uniref:Uncharacterized protein n=1 Tax=Echinococcus granulosus TaxID=6210 RepID=W6U854_ECHGR|nr:hypothetical protein EGR_07804 [Echinococcus granulosus]EUB57345.1 hypothetical protein EGR_07804 [Echinococcus granulosus]